MTNSPDDLRRGAHPSDDHWSDDMIALREALADMGAGDHGQALAEFDRAFRESRNLSPRE